MELKKIKRAYAELVKYHYDREYKLKHKHVDRCLAVIERYIKWMEL